MSKILKEKGYLSHFIKTDRGKIYYLDSAFTFDAGLETMAFPAYQDSDGKCHVTNWGDIYVEHYNDYDKMLKRHHYICENFEKVVYVEKVISDLYKANEKFLQKFKQLFLKKEKRRIKVTFTEEMLATMNKEEANNIVY